MVNKWVFEPLDKLVDEIVDRRGITPLKLGSDFLPTGYRVISAKVIKDSRVDLDADEPRFVDYATYRKWMRTPLMADDVILTSEAPLGEVAYINEPVNWCLGQRLFAIRTNKKRLNGRFLYYALQFKDVMHDLQSRATGTTAQGIRQTELRRIGIPLPPIGEQRAIAHILGSIDDKIKINREMNATLEAMVRTTFKSWFVDFNPVLAKSEERKQILNRKSVDLFPSEFQNSEIGRIPKGWKIGCLADVAIFNNETLSVKDHLENIDYIEISEVSLGDVGKITRYIRGNEPSRARRRLRHGDTVISTVRPDRGSHFLCLNPPETLIASTGFATLTPKEGRWAFVYLATTQPEIGKELGRLADGGAYPAIRSEVIEKLKIVVPDDGHVIDAFEAIVQPILLRIENNRSENKTLASIRGALLPKLLSGELRANKINVGES